MSINHSFGMLCSFFGGTAFLVAGYFVPEFESSRSAYLTGIGIVLLLSFLIYKLRKKPSKKNLAVAKKNEEAFYQKYWWVMLIGIVFVAPAISNWIQQNTARPPDWIGAFMFGLIGAFGVMGGIAIILYSRLLSSSN